MTMGKRTQAAELEIQLLREGILESVHRAQAVVCDHRGRVLSVAGNAETASFIRSALKPFQAVAVTTTGTLERYDLSDRDLAIICSSHQGTLEQVRQVFISSGAVILMQPPCSAPHLREPTAPCNITVLGNTPGCWQSVSSDTGPSRLTCNGIIPCSS